jgi:hypothetical protein
MALVQLFRHWLDSYLERGITISAERDLCLHARDQLTLEILPLCGTSRVRDPSSWGKYCA